MPEQIVEDLDNSFLIDVAQEIKEAQENIA